MNQPSPHIVRPPAKRARLLALVLSILAVAASIGFGVFLRRTIPLLGALDHPDRYTPTLTRALAFLLVALLLRMAASICELVWLERTWSNLPEALRNVGPVERVSSGLAVGLSFVPGLSWVWKLGLVLAVSDGFERIRAVHPFRGPVPKRLGMAAVIVAWVPGLNVYVAPFLWELFATRIDRASGEIRASQGVQQSAPAVPSP